MSQYEVLIDGQVYVVPEGTAEAMQFRAAGDTAYRCRMELPPERVGNRHERRKAASVIRRAMKWGKLEAVEVEGLGKYLFPPQRYGFTLIELLIVIAIIGILASLILCSVQYARESARRVHCANNLRQVALGFHHHHDAVRHLPTGGWGYGWVGDPDAGMGAKQPGGWPYGVLDFIEQSALRRIGSGRAGALKRDELSRLVSHPIAAFHCPSLRPAVLYPITLQPANAARADRGAKVDYAANAGAGMDEWDAGSPDAPPRDWGGIVCVKSTTSLAQITDGLSNTILLGEKFLHPLHRDSGTCWGDNETLYTGLDNDSVRSTKFPPQTIGGRESYPLTFGSYHPGSFNAAMADGRTESVSYAIDARVFRAMGTRNGNEVNQ